MSSGDGERRWSCVCDLGPLITMTMTITMIRTGGSCHSSSARQFNMPARNNQMTKFATLAGAQCIVIGPVCLWVSEWVCVCVFVCVCGGVDLLPRKLEITCIDPHKTGFGGKSSDRLSWLNFGRPALREGGSAGGEFFFGSALLQPGPARTVCVSSERFFHCIM